MAAVDKHLSPRPPAPSPIHTGRDAVLCGLTLTRPFVRRSVSTLHMLLTLHGVKLMKSPPCPCGCTVHVGVRTDHIISQEVYGHMVRTCARTLDGGSRAPVPSVRPSVTWARLNNGTTSTGPKQSEVRARCTRQFLNSSTSTPPSSRGLGVSRRLRRSSRRTLASPGLDGLDGPSLTRVGSGQWQSTAGRARALTNERRCASATEPSRPPNPRGTGCIALHWRRRAALVLVAAQRPGVVLAPANGVARGPASWSSASVGPRPRHMWPRWRWD